MIEGLNHYNLRSDPDTMEALKDFYINIVGLSLGFRPPFESNGYWLYANNKDVLHLSETKNNEKKNHHVNSTFDHMAFTAKDFQKIILISTIEKCLKLAQNKFFLKILLEMA